MQLALRNARLVDAAGDVPSATLVIRGAALDTADSAASIPALELDGAIVTPGFVDVHTHGGGGYNLHTTDVAEIESYARWAPSTGTTSFLLGVVGVPETLPEAQIAAALTAIRAQGNAPAAEALGIHLEGPYMSVARRGAHDPSWLRLPDPAETEHLLEITAGSLRLVTLAPELPGAHAMIERLAAAGITVSIGHTDSNYAQAREGIAHGIRHATHCFNAMRPLLHRDPGPLGAIVEADQVLGEIIGDGVHVHPAAARIMLRALGPERAVIVTDALACAGLPDAVFTFAGQEARVIDGVARLSDGTITGSVLTMDQALRNVVQLVGVPLHEAVGMLTRNPARSAGVADRKGLLQPGYDADLLIFDAGLQLQATICRGTLAWATPEWRARWEAAQP
jgi:N-acetylglucosamine-6-phosphate deacetylase